MTGAHGPTQGMATGALRYWNDGRDALDVVLGLFDYREGFNLSLRVNFVDGGEESEGLVFTGDEGTLEIGWTGVTLSRVPRETEPGLTIDTFPEAMQSADRDGLSQEVSAEALRGQAAGGFGAVCGAEGLQRQLRPLQELLRIGSLAAAGGGGRGVRVSCGRCGAVEQSQHRTESHCAAGIRTR